MYGCVTAAMYENGRRWIRNASKPCKKEVSAVTKVVLAGVLLLGGTGVVIRLLMGTMLRAS